MDQENILLNAAKTQAVYKLSISAPSPSDIRAARQAAGLTQKEAAQLISPEAGEKAYRTWQRYEADPSKRDHRQMPLVSWEAFLLLTNQHPLWLLTRND